MNGSRKIKELPLLMRPREKALHYGINTLSDVELLALLIGKGTRQENAIQLAQKLLDRHLSVQNLSRISDPRLLTCNGVGPVKALQIVAVFELNRRVIYTEGIENELRYNELNLASIYQKKIGRSAKENLYLISLNRRNVILGEKQLYIGNAKGFLLDANEVVRELLLINASRYILIHNHPSGLIEPSQDDIDTTIKLAKYTAKFGIELYDHLIIGINTYYSMKNHQK